MQLAKKASNAAAKILQGNVAEEAGRKQELVSF